MPAPVRLTDLVSPGPDEEFPGGPSTRRRRWAAVGITLLAGASLLAATLRVQPGSDEFAALGVVAAAVWVAGALASGPVRLRPPRPSSVVRVAAQAAVVGVAAFLVFLVAYLVGQHVPGVDPALDRILAKADAGSPWTVLGIALLNGVAEEVFFRGAVYEAVPASRRLTVTTLIYVVVTVATGNVALVAAAAVMGIVFVLERRSTGSILAPIVTHLVWSTLMIVALPR